MKTSFAALIVATLVIIGSSTLSGCDTPPAPADAGTAGGTAGGLTGGGSTGGGTAGGSGGGTAGGSGGGTAGGSGGGAAIQLDTPQRILNFLEGKTLTMEGMNIPTHPNGISENLNLGGNSQCYQKTVIRVMAGQFQVTSTPATINSLDGGTLMVGQVGRCDRTVRGPMDLSFNSSGVTFANVQGNATCFDVDVNYGVFRQEGRASINAAGTEITMELFFQNGAVNHRCANGAVGSAGVVQVVMGNMIPFTGNAQQKYVITQ
ncbi:MAG: hypothetical protein MUC96_10190 [Myxococcaceae bacterium]|jgi:hypothetical protein|nr:hypothetical protein [Myxococcaceae bacterium]